MDITDVEVLHDHVVRLRFADGVEKAVDLDPYLHGRVFAEIRKNSARVRVGEGRRRGRHDRVAEWR